jgi:hypothetical protein
MGSVRRVLKTRRASHSEEGARAQQGISEETRRWPRADDRAACIRGHCLCAEDWVPVEVIAQGTIRECKLGAQVLPAVAQNGVLPGHLACRSCRVRRNGGDRLEVAEHRWSHDQSTPRAGSNWSKPDGPGEKREASVTSWWAPVASRCR